MIPVFVNGENEKSRRGEWLLLLLALPVSFLCVGLMTYLALWIWPDQTVQANMLAQDKANYDGHFSQSTRFAYVDPSIIIDVTADAAGLRVTPSADAGRPARVDEPVFIVPGPIWPTAVPPGTAAGTAVATDRASAAHATVATHTAEANATRTTYPTQTPAHTPEAPVSGANTPTDTPVPAVSTATPSAPIAPTSTNTAQPTDAPPPASTPTPTNTPPPTSTAPPATNTPTSTNTPRPTSTPQPAPATATATFTPAPSDTPAPTQTATPAPTAIPVSVQPMAECVQDNGDGTFTAYFGYLNDNAYAVDVPVGPDNRFNPAPHDRGQPTTFQPGRVVAAFSVVANDNITLIWRLQGERTSAASDSTPCSQ